MNSIQLMGFSIAYSHIVKYLCLFIICLALAWAINYCDIFICLC